MTQPLPVTELTDTNFRETLGQSPMTFVDIYASWCGSCRLFAPTYGQVAAKYPKAAFYKIDGDAHPQCRSELTIPNLPFIAFYRDGKFVDGISTTTEEGFEEFIAKMGV